MGAGHQLASDKFRNGLSGRSYGRETGNIGAIRRAAAFANADANSQTPCQ